MTNVSPEAAPIARRVLVVEDWDILESTRAWIRKPFGELLAAVNAVLGEEMESDRGASREKIGRTPLPPHYDA